MLAEQIDTADLNFVESGADRETATRRVDNRPFPAIGVPRSAPLGKFIVATQLVRKPATLVVAEIVIASLSVATLIFLAFSD